MRVHELNDVRRLDAVDEAAVLVDPPARRHLEIQGEVGAECGRRPGVARDAVRDRVADHGDMLNPNRARLPGERGEDEHGHDEHQGPPHHGRS